ncbi:MAG: PorV/PorQ family protein [Phycisphaerales bacterium]|nr:PorV/PorQ family protein [Phycisphaerales bacterium]
MSKKIFFLGVFMIAVAKGFAQAKIYVNEYLNIGVGARGLAMGGAVTASSNDANSSYWNPAGLTGLEQAQFAFMHAEYFSGNAKYDFLAIAKPSKDHKRIFAFSALRFATDDIPYTIDYVQPDGSLDESKLKSISAGDYAFLLSYAFQLKVFKNPNVKSSLGVNAKIIYRNIGSMANAWGGGIDVGWKLSGRHWLLGIAAKDITTTYTTWSFNLTDKEKEVFGQTGNEIPVKSYEVMNPRFNVGLGYNFMKATKKLQLLAELNTDITTDGKRNTLIKSNTLSIDPRIGLELGYNKTIFFRAGVCNIQKVLDDKDSINKRYYTIFQPSMGLGLKIGSLSVDYAYTSLQTQNNPLLSHIISAKWEFYRKKKKEVEKIEKLVNDESKASTNK